jgi:peptide/nickel transport system substrate-binding protein
VTGTLVLVGAAVVGVVSTVVGLVYVSPAFGERFLRQWARILRPIDRERWTAEWVGEARTFPPGQRRRRLLYTASVAVSIPVMALQARALRARRGSGSHAHRLVAAAAVAAFALFAMSTAAASGPKPIASLRIGEVAASSTLDFTKSQDGLLVAQFGLETLMSYGRNGQLVPWLATSVSHPGRDIYVYHLRHGVRFWDGTELTSADVANSLNYERYPDSQVGYAYVTVKSIQATNRYTVTVTLKHPDPNWDFDAAWDSAAIFEKKFEQAHKLTFGQPGTLLMGTGPWRIDSYDPTSGAELSANPHWWGGAPAIRHISIKLFSDENSMALAFRAGAIDVAGVGGLGDPRAFLAAAGANVNMLTAPSISEVFFSMNTQAAPWNDIHVRRAVAYAVNRPDLIKAAGGYASAVTTMILPVQLGSVGSVSGVHTVLASLPQYPHSLAKAQAELAKSGYPHGFTFTLDEPNYWNIPFVAQAFAGQLQKIGITAQVNPVSVGDWFAALLGPADKRPPTIIGVTSSPDPSQKDIYFDSKDVVNGQWNIANYVRPEVDSLITSEESTSNPAKRLQIIQKLLKQYATDLPYLSLYSPTVATALSTRFSWPSYSFQSFYNGSWPLRIKSA